MHGHFKTSLIPVGNYTDEDFVRAMQNGTIDDLAKSIGPIHETDGDNLVHDSFPAFIFDSLLTGPSIPNAIGRGAGNGAFLSIIVMSNYASEPVYNRAWSDAWTGYSAEPNNVGTGSTKRFIEDQATSTYDLFIDPTGRQSIIFRNKFLYRTTEANADIYSIDIWYRHDGDATGTTYISPACRIRLKDNAGVPTIISKTSSEVLLVEYTFTVTNI